MGRLAALTRAGFTDCPAAIDQIWRQCQFVEEEEKEETEYFVLLIDGQTVVLERFKRLSLMCLQLSVNKKIVH